MNITDAIRIATSAHHRQVDKAGEPYIFHPLRVMEALRARGEPVETQVCGVLHDVLEDAPMAAADLEAWGCSPAQLCTLELLTKRPGQPYADYIDRICVSGDRAAIMVKLADVTDNLRPARLQNVPSPARHRLIDKYTAALRTLVLRAQP